MDMTFGIIVAPDTPYGQLDHVVRSITKMFIDLPDYAYQIVLVGGNENIPKLTIPNCIIQWVDFDETVKPKWITRKKNIITQNFESTWFCLVHDYFIFEPGFIKTFMDKRSETDANVMQTRMLIAEHIGDVSKQDSRHSDWLIDPRITEQFYAYDPDAQGRASGISPNEEPKYVCGLPYEVTDLTHLQYISGGFICARDYIMKAVPQNENLVWGQAEDLEWTDRLRLVQPRISITDKHGITLRKRRKWAVKNMCDIDIDNLRDEYGSCPWQKNRW